MVNFNNPRLVATTATASATVAKGKHTPVDATAGALTMTLPTTAAAGVEVSVEKVDASTNTVTISGTLRGAASTITLASQYETRTFLSEGSGSWRPTSDHRTAAALTPRPRRLPARSRTIHPSPPTVADATTHGMTSPINIPATVAENPFMTKLAGGAFVDIGSNRITAGQTNPGTAIRDPFSVEVYYTCAAASSVAFNITSAPGNTYRLWVDDQPVGSWVPTAGAGGGATRYIKLSFAAAGTYKVRIDLTYADLLGILTGPTDSLGRTTPRGPRCVVVGDSYTGGSGSDPTGYSGITSWLQTFAEIVGWDDVWNAGIGGTGIIAGSPNFQTRAAGIVGLAPDVLIVQAGKNDYPANTAAQIGTAASSLFATLRAGLPYATIIALGPLSPGAPTTLVRDTTWGPVEDAIFTAAKANGVLTVPTANAGIFTGTGKAGSPTGTGTGDVLIQADGTHPTGLGAVTLGRRLAGLISPLLG